MGDLCFFDELLVFVEHCVNDQNSSITAGDFIFHFENLSDPNTKNVHHIAAMSRLYRLSVSLVQTVTEPTHGRGHTLNQRYYSKGIDKCHDKPVNGVAQRAGGWRTGTPLFRSARNCNFL